MAVGKKANGRLKKGYRYAKGGRVVKAGASSRRRAGGRKKRRSKRAGGFLGIF